jgi:hypothetical protein
MQGETPSSRCRITHHPMPTREMSWSCRAGYGRAVGTRSGPAARGQIQCRAYTGQRSSPGFSEQASALALASAAFGQLFNAKPTPVNTMVPDQAV